MKTLTAVLQKLHLGRVVMVFLAGVVLLLTTACNNGDAMGARPNNPPVQMGGSNNPHKAGGDGYTNYKMSTDSKLKDKSNRAALPDGQLVAAINSNASDVLYPSPDAKTTKSPAIGPVGNQGKRELMDATKIPAERQPVIDRSDPDNKILEKAGQAFKDASGFLKDTAESASEYPEMQANPGIGK